MPEGHLLLQTLRSHDQFNTTIYGLSDRYRGIEGGRKVVFVHPDDITHLGFANGDVVDIVSHWPDDDRERIVKAIPHRRVRHAARFSGGVLPGDESAGPPGLHRARQQHPDVEVDHRQAATRRPWGDGWPRHRQPAFDRRVPQVRAATTPPVLTNII